MRFSPRRLIALLLLAVTFCGLLTSFSENVVCAGELPGVHESATTCDHDGTQISHGGTPDTPDTHPAGDHICLGDCGCPCHAPLPSVLLSFSISRISTRFAATEPVHFLPEVYLSLFDPPDVTA
jgi:hypothetical protein